VNRKKSSLVKCFHGDERCATCALDCGAANQLWHLWQHRAKGAAALPDGVVQTVAAAFLARCAKGRQRDGALRSAAGDFAAAVPNARRRAELDANFRHAVGRSATEGRSAPSLEAAASAAAFACYVACELPIWAPKAGAALEAFLAAAISLDSMSRPHEVD
jgi:hypothetical protein